MVPAWLPRGVIVDAFPSMGLRGFMGDVKYAMLIVVQVLVR